MPPVGFSKAQYTVERTYIKDKGIFEYRCQMPFYNRKDPLSIVVESAKRNDAATMDVFDTLAHESVQRRFEKDNGIGKAYASQLKEIQIANSFGPEKITGTFDPDKVYVEDEKKTIMLSFLKARYLRGDGIAWVLSGGSDKGFAYPWIFKQLEDMGLIPNFVYATSTAAYFGGLYCFYQNAAKVIDLVKGVIKTKNWHQLVDIGLKYLFKKPNNYKGFIPGRYLMDTMKKECGLKDVYFSDLKIPLFVSSVRIPAAGNKNGKPVIFCDPNLAYMMSPGYEDIVKYDYKVVVGARASGSIPLAFEYFNINGEMDGVKTADGKPLTSVELREEYHMDGGLYENLPYNAMRRNKNVGFSFGVHFGDSGESEKGINNCIEAGSWAVDFLGRGQMAGLVNRSGVNEVYFNPNFRRLETLKGLERGQYLGLSAAYGIRKVFGVMLGSSVYSASRKDKDFMNEVKVRALTEIKKLAKDKRTPEKQQELEAEIEIKLKEEKRQLFLKALFTPINEDQENAMKKVATVTPKNEEVVYVEEKDPYVNIDPTTESGAEAWRKLLDDDGGRVEPKPVHKDEIAWLWDQAKEQINPFRAFLLFSDIVIHKYALKFIFWTKQSLLSSKKKPKSKVV
jgi:predicted acylesterase/phospholipase RssA